MSWDDDTPLPEDEQIKAVHPARTDKRHDLYQEAMRLVGARHSKSGLVELVNWLLHRVSQANERACEYKAIIAASQAPSDPEAKR